MFALFTESIVKDKKRAYILAGVGVVLLIAAGVNLTSPARHKGHLKNAVLSLVAADTFHIKTELDLHLPAKLRNNDRPIVGITSRVEGDVDNRGERPEVAGNLYVEARGRGMTLFADGEVFVMPDDVVFNLENLPVLLNPKGTLVDKWTKVETPILKTNNPEDIKTAIGGALGTAKYVGKEVIPGTDNEVGEKFTKTFTADEEFAISEAFRQGVSGNKGLHVITRLLRAFNVQNFAVYVVDDQVRLIQADFVPENEDDTRGGTLTITLSDYGKDVSVEAPQFDVTVDSEVFGRIFGKGEIEEF